MRTYRFPNIASTLLAGLMLAVSVSTTTAKSENSSEMTALHDSVQKWIEVRKEDEKLKSDWEWQKNVLENTKLSLEKQIKNSTTELTQFKSEYSEKIQALKTLETESKDFDQILQLSESQIESQIQQFLGFKERFPPRLKKALELSFATLTDPELTLNDRLQVFVTAMGRVSQFNHLITYSEELVTIDDQSRLMAVIYWGLGQAYALDLSSNDGFIGKPDAQEWKWNESKGIASKMKTLIAIFREETDPVYVELPITID